MSLPAKPQQLRQVYLDHAATTPMHPDVVAAMIPYFTDQFHNASALYRGGLHNRRAIDDARKRIATHLGSQSDTIIFTSGGTESCNLAILGFASHYEQKHGKPGHIITTNIEHHAVLHACKKLEAQGWEVTYLEVDSVGYVSADAVKQAIQTNTALVTVMYANNEIGTILPIADIGRTILQHRKKQETIYPLFHTDACQATPALELHVEKLHVDFMSINGSKIYGPKGAGLLYKRRDVQLNPMQLGGSQEFGYRSGTENTAAIVALAVAIDVVRDAREDQKHINDLKKELFEGLKSALPEIELNGPELDPEKRLANNLNIQIPRIDQEALLLYLDEYGIQIGIGSACTNRNNEGSHVIEAIGKPRTGNIRLTLGKDTSKEDIAYVVEYIPAVVRAVQKLSA